MTTTSRTPGTDGAGRPDLRADAAQNRDRILTSARELFDLAGIGVPMADIARRADVGIATLYRRFPSKPSLLSAVFGDQIRSCAAEFESSADVADPWSTLQGLLVRLCALQAENKGLAGLLVDAFVTGHEFEEERLLLRRSLIRLVERAREAGRAHPDIDIASIELLLKANAGVIAASTGDPGADSAHFVGLMLRSFEPAPPPSAAEPGGGR